MLSEFTQSAAGKKGKEVRSDCYIELILKKSGGININLGSKVKVLYGDSIKELILDMCKFFDLEHAEINITDNGALPFVIAARFECAVKRLAPDITKEYLLPATKKIQKITLKDDLRRSRLYLPGNEPKFFINAGLHAPDGIILDLEDSVAYSEKDAAQLLVRNALRSVDFYGAERMVRINQIPKGLEDLKFIVPHNVNCILIPKCENAEQVIAVDEEVARLRKLFKVKCDTWLMPIIESAMGVINAYQIASSCSNVCALAMGLEDYTADIGAQRTNEGTESFYARTSVINAAKAAGVQAIDTVFSDVSDMDNLTKSVLEAKALGFEGKGCIHPRQVKVVHEAFAPTINEIEKAKKIVLAFDEATKLGLGVVSLGSKMIDPPVVKRAIKTIDMAIKTNLVTKNWKDML
ncbi:MAG TPA: aldolase/citrate lyase family protein [Melioribacteraceae bacterium]|nr:aldolase/citrate lyase family protein [Melioribacteraceae bacterium]